MPNHTHFVMEPTIDESLPKIMLKLTLAHTRYFNAKYESVGHAWQGRYKSSLIDSDDYFIWCGIYCELNPVRAKMVKKPEDWQWSSYRYYAFGDLNRKINDLIDCDPYYEKLGKDDGECRRAYRENIGKIMDNIFLEKTRKQLGEGICGKKGFIENMKERFKIESTKSPGRPRKNQS